MKKVTPRITHAIGLVLLLAGFALPLQASTWKVGFVFVSVGNGQYKVYDNAGNFLETITDSQGGTTDTAGCACDSTYHLYTTNLTNTKVDRRAIPHPHNVIQTITETPSSLGSNSIVFDGSGNFYVGHANAGTITKYDPAGVLQQTFSVGTELGGADWIDLSSDQTTLFYTSRGRIIFKFSVSGTGTQLANFADLGNAGGPNVELRALRLLSNGNVLVADERDIKQVGSGDVIVKTYDASGENDWFALNLDPNGTSFWAGDKTTGNFYRFNIATGTKELGPISTSAPSKLRGICLYGAFSAAQPQPVIQTFTFTANPLVNSHTFSFDSGNNTITLTLSFLNSSQPPVVGTVRFTKIDPAAGTSDGGLPCSVATLDDPGKCVVYEVEFDPASSISSVFVSVFSIVNSFNPVYLDDSTTDFTAFVLHDESQGGGPIEPGSVISQHELTPTTGSVSCGYVNLKTLVNQGATGKLKFQVRAAGGDCVKGPFVTTETWGLRIVRLVNGIAVEEVTTQVAGNSGGIFTITKTGTFYEAEVKWVLKGTFVATAFELNDKSPSFSCAIETCPTTSVITVR